MAADRDAIIAKYRRVARLPDQLFFFTFPLRRLAVGRLNLSPGQSVLEAGCGSGPNFSLLRKAVGPTGHITGLDISPDMAAAARDRAARAGWANVTVIEGAAEEVVWNGEFDALLLFAMHDVLTSPRALDRLLQAVKPEGRVAAAGPFVPSRGPARLLAPLVRAVFHRFAVSRADMDRPWRLLEQRLPGWQVSTHGPMFLAWGDTPGVDRAR